MHSQLPEVVDSLKTVSDTLKVYLINPEPETSFKDWLAPATALLAVFLGPLITLWLGNRQNEIQRKIAEDQIKANVLSTNRQQWIHILREQLAELNSAAALVMWHLKLKTIEDKEFPERLSRIYFLESKIKLLLNPDKPLQKALLDEVEKVTNQLSKKTDLNNFQESLDSMNMTAQTLFRDVWLKVKSLS